VLWKIVPTAHDSTAQEREWEQMNWGTGERGKRAQELYGPTLRAAQRQVPAAVKHSALDLSGWLELRQELKECGVRRRSR